MSHSAILNFTSAGPERLIEKRGSQSWKLNADRAREAEFLVCVQNRKEGTRWGASEPHGEAFLIGRVEDVVPSDEVRGRWRIAISDYARIKVPGAWKGLRFPIRYTTLEDLGIDVEGVKFAPLPGTEEQVNRVGEPMASDEVGEGDEYEVRPLTIEQAKAGLAAHYKVKPEAIKVTIQL